MPPSQQAPIPAGHHTEQVVEPKVPFVDAASIRQIVASLARYKLDAGKVLDTISASTLSTSLGYERAHTLTYEHGLNRRFANGQVIHDYHRDVHGERHLDFSTTQEAVYRNQQVVQRNVQTLISEKVRLDCARR